MAEYRVRLTDETIGRLLSNNFFRLPSYQRPYMGGQEKLQSLLAELISAFKQRHRHYLGAIVTVRDDQQMLTLVDGQQRLVSISLIIAAIRSHFRTHGDDERASEIERTYLFSRRDLRTMSKVAHLSLAPDSNAAFRQIAEDTQEATSENESRWSKVMNDAAEFIAASVPEIGTSTESLIEFIEFLNNQVEVTFVVAPELDAVTIADNLRTQGISIGFPDSIKTYIFNTATSRAWEVEQLWQKFETILTMAGRTVEPDVFLRHYWNSRYDYVERQEGLLIRMQDTITSQQQAVDFCESLVQSVEHYASLFNSAHQVWTSISPSMQMYVLDLNAVQLSIMTPLVLSIVEFFSSNQQQLALQRLIAWSIRLIITEEQSADEPVARAISAAAGAISSRQLTTSADLEKRLKDDMPSNQEFQGQFGKWNCPKKNGALIRYVLRELEGYNRDILHVGAELIPSYGTDQVNPEHILPRSANNAEWPQFSAAEKISYLWRLGNMTLLASRPNAKEGNASFAAKKASYTSSAFTLTQLVGKESNWTPSSIEGHQAKLAKMAVKVWPLVRS